MYVIELTYIFNSSFSGNTKLNKLKSIKLRYLLLKIICKKKINFRFCLNFFLVVKAFVNVNDHNNELINSILTLLNFKI